MHSGLLPHTLCHPGQNPAFLHIKYRLGYIIVDKILKLYFGPDCNEQAYRAILENAALASKYQQKYLAEYKVPEDQKNIPNITYALFSAPAASASADDKKKAEASAREMLGKCKSIDDLKKLGADAKSSGVCRDAGTLPVQKGKMVPAFEKWAYGAERKEGEMDVIYSDEYGYFCVGYNGLVELDDSEKKDMASNALNAEIDAAVKAGQYTLKTNKAFPSPKPYAPATDKNSNTGNVLLIVFACIGGAAIVIIIIVLIMNAVKGNKPSKKAVVKSGGSKKKKSGNKRR